MATNVIKIDEHEAQDIAYGDHPDYLEVDEIEHDTSRWHMFVETIVKRESDGKLFSMEWQRGLTESQENEFYISELVEVERKTRTVEEVYYEEV